MFNNKSIFVSGGTGSFGKKFVETVFKKFKPKKVIIYSRDEQKHFQLQKKWKFKNIRFLLVMLEIIIDYLMQCMV